MNNERTPAFYLANLGSEVLRLQAALAKNDTELTEGALKRARAIFDTLAHVSLRPAERKEIELLRDVVEDMPKEKHAFSIQPQTLHDYFMPFAKRVLTAA